MATIIKTKKNFISNFKNYFNHSIKISINHTPNYRKTWGKGPNSRLLKNDNFSAVLKHFSWPISIRGKIKIICMEL